MAVRLSTGDSINLGDWDALDNQGALTYCAWMRFESTAVQARLLQDYSGASTSGIGISFETGGVLQVVVPDGVATPSVVSAAGVQSTGAWMHVAVVYDGSTTGSTNRVKLYKDAARLDGSSAGGDIPANTQANTLACTIGSSFDGRLALMKVWQAALGPNEIANEMWSYWPQRTENLVGFRPFDDGAANWKDYSGSSLSVVSPSVITGTGSTDGPPVNVGHGPQS